MPPKSVKKRQREEILEKAREEKRRRETGNRVSLGLFLCFQLTKQLDIRDIKAAELSGIMIGKSDKTVREWRTQFFENNGEIPESKQGKYQRSGIRWTSEDLNKKASGRMLTSKDSRI